MSVRLVIIAPKAVLEDEVDGIKTSECSVERDRGGFNPGID